MQGRVFSPSLLMMSVCLALSVSQPVLAIDSYWSGYTDDKQGQHNTVNSQLGSVAIGNENSSTARHTFAGGERTKVTRMVGFGYGSDVEVTGAWGTAFGKQTKVEGSYSFAAGYQSEAKGKNSVAMGDGSKANGQGSVALGSGNEANGTSSFATGNNSKAEGQLSFAQGFHSRATGRGAIAMGGGENYIRKGETSKTTDSVTAEGDYSVALGYKSVAKKDRSVALSGGHADGLSAFAFGREVIPGNSLGDEQKDKITYSEANGDFSISMGRITKANANYAIALGNESVANGVGSIALGQKALAQNANALAMGGNAQATLENSIALGEGSVANRAKGQAGFDIKTGAASTETSSAWVATENAMAVGDGDKVTRQITGVAAGSEDTDAVNVAQLKRVNDNLSTVDDKVNGVNDQVTANTTHINQIETRVSDLDSRIDRTGANAAALAALHPLDYDPNNKFNFAGGYGNYRGKNAVAIGAFYRPNPRVMFSVGGSTGGSEHMINAGVSFTLGKVSQYAELSKTQLIETINRQETRLSAQQESLDEQKAKVEALEAQVAELVNKLNKLAK